MNFSKSLKLRKVLSLILVMTMMITAFAGCKKDEKPGTSQTEPNAGPSLIEPNPSESTPEPTETEPPVINENTATVLSQINVRSAPTTESVVTGTLFAGDKVEISRREGLGGVEWAYITSPQPGWIVMEYVKMDIEPDTPAGSDTSTPAGQNQQTDPSESDGQTIKGVINASNLNIREDASKNGKIIGNYTKGEVITILETKNGWGRTDKGWILMDYVTTGGSTGNAGTSSNNNDDDKTTTATGNGSTTVQFKGIVTASELNIRANPSTDGERIGALKAGARVEILEKSGNWGRTKDGWISLDYVYQDGTTGKNTAKGIVTGDELNVRSGPGTGYDSVGSLNYGDRVTILEQFTYNGTTWGCTKDGWISMTYVFVDGTKNDDSEYATVTGDELNIRSGPGTGYDSVGVLDEGDEIVVHFILKVGGTSWGNIDKGWVCMDYVELD